MDVEGRLIGKTRAKGWAGKCIAALLVCGLVGCGSNGTDESASPTTTRETVPTTERPTTTTTEPEAVPRAQIIREIREQSKAACDEAVLSSTDPIIDYSDRWTSEMTMTEYRERVETCVAAAWARLNAAEAERKAAEERAAAEAAAAEAAAAQAAAEAEIANARPVNVDEIIKNPDAFKGQVFKLVSEITQFDGATGPCSFRGYWDNTSHEYNFEYAGDNAYFTSGDGISSCPTLTGIDQNDVVRLWVRSTGAYSYGTQIGGNTTAPGFEVLRAEVISKK